MKSFSYFLAVILVFSCGPRTEKNESNAEVSTKSMEESSHTGRTEQFVKDYIAAVNSSNWKQELPKYLKPNSEAFLEEHSAFRTSFPNFKSDIKHLVANGEEVIVWLEHTANYAVDYTFEKSDYGDDDVLNGIKAENQPLKWNETWYFDVVDGKFGDKWDFLKDNHTIVRQLTGESSP